ncbi:MAG: transcriptional repressor [Clostridia bacterium]|nr:transcriptional repressor [Clostridia bacterium]
MQRYSKKRQSILECLSETKEHPTAEWVYTKIKSEYPSLSLATVYRNLSMLKSEGVIRSVGTVNGQERFDADVTPHIHALCTKCGRVTDVAGISVPEDIGKIAESTTGFTVLRTELTVTGICALCSKEGKNNE